MVIFSPELNSEGKYKKLIIWENSSKELEKKLIDYCREYNAKIENEWSKAFGPELIQSEIEVQYATEYHDPESSKEEK